MVKEEEVALEVHVAETEAEDVVEIEEEEEADQISEAVIIEEIPTEAVPETEIAKKMKKMMKQVVFSVLVDTKEKEEADTEKETTIVQ
jgi:hypothetical protein